jgi:hypothetical protein
MYHYSNRCALYARHIGIRKYHLSTVVNQSKTWQYIVLTNKELGTGSDILVIFLQKV